ncbi:hypothetical protein BURC_04757 [Burkholderiaceae bacterium]|nr:hypothetical protein BURC_04757 [Burkholderiaceae bacterium]
MSLREFQRALTSMTLDVGFANAVHARGEQALAAYDLLPREARRLAAVVRQPGMALTCTLARANRFASIHDAFPMTCVLLGRALRGVLDELWSARLPDNVQLQGEEQPFAELVQRRLAADDAHELNEHLPAILAYERSCLELAQLVRHAARPELAPQETRWVAFAHDPQALFASLEKAQQPSADMPQGDYRVRITLVEGELEVATFEVPAAQS